jgi:hypothetical protein
MVEALYEPTTKLKLPQKLFQLEEYLTLNINFSKRKIYKVEYGACPYINMHLYL